MALALPFGQSKAEAMSVGRELSQNSHRHVPQVSCADARGSITYCLSQPAASIPAHNKYYCLELQGRSLLGTGLQIKEAGHESQQSWHSALTVVAGARRTGYDNLELIDGRANRRCRGWRLFARETRPGNLNTESRRSTIEY